MGLKRQFTLKSVQTFLQIQNLEFFSADILREHVEHEYQKKIKKVQQRR